MALREYEQRILTEIEQRLTEDDPRLAGTLAAFGADDPAFARDGAGGWRPWAVCAAVAVAVVGLLTALFLSAPDAPVGSAPADAPTAPAGAA
ncbi:DUF3040 domain-containing protein [Nocardiopsis trehalosi]|jgi:anti-sigma-K factor RskA|uniref:DUF3040 domain-containing protein n=1 Tax=Nocardiopsis trehalosi TaxID=109329 RepID=UPI00083432CA|nr:DUF3040 domain-containing protein [Nocardiopsis trehalosi]